MPSDPITVADVLDVIAEVERSPALVPDSAEARRVPLTAVTHDSRAVAPGSLFACLPGERTDGHRFAGDAVAAGASCLLVERRVDLPGGAGGPDDHVVPQIVVTSTRALLGPVAAAISGHPARRLVTVGITGTNGKTTTAAMLAAILEAAGHRTGVVGTLHGPRTTPEAPELQATLAGFVTAGCSAAVLEVSSHALALHRVDGTRFDAAVFTNLGHDHLDLHGSQEAYFRAKARLFEPAFTSTAVVNVDDVHGRLLADSLATDPQSTVTVVPYSPHDATDVDVRPDASEFTWRERRVVVPVGGGFNVANAVAALTTASALGVPVDVAVAGLAGLPPIPGRFESVTPPDGSSLGFAVVVDYAHTPDGLAEVLAAARRAAHGARVVLVFGCGGDRDREKRGPMGRVAAEGADVVVVTSDNPRREDPASIIDDVVAGCVGSTAGADHVRREPDRRAAIAHALSVAGPGDVVVVAGKGHERTQELADRVIDFDDRDVVRSLLPRRGIDASAVEEDPA